MIGENRFLHFESGNAKAELPDQPVETPNVGETPHESSKDAAESLISDAERDTEDAKERLEKSVEKMKKATEAENEDEVLEETERRIHILNERQLSLNASLPEEVLKKTFVGQVLQSSRFGISEDGRTYESANFDMYRKLFSEASNQKGFKVLREDRDGKVYGFDDSEGRDKNGVIESETREDAIRLYKPIDELEKRMTRAEALYSAEKIKEDPKYREEFNERNGVQAVAGKITDTSIDFGEPSEEFPETVAKAKLFQEELKNLLNQVPESAKQTAMLKLVAGSEVAVDRDGKMLMVFVAEHGSEFRALAQSLFAGFVGHTRVDEDGRYAVEVVPASVSKLIARLKLVFLTEEAMTFDELKTNLEIIRDGGQIETPGIIKEHARMLNDSLKSLVTDVESEAGESPAGKFLSGMRFDADNAGRLTFSHKSTESVLRFFQQIDSDTFESSDEIFKGIRLKMKDGTFHSDDLSPERATQLIEKLQEDLRSPVTETTEEEEKPAKHD